MICNDCGKGNIYNHNQRKVKSLEFGTYAKFKRNYRCKKCISLEKTDPFSYQLSYGKPLKKMRAEFRKQYREYHKTEKTQSDFICLVESYHQILRDNNLGKHLDREEIVWEMDGARRMKSITIKNFPFVGEVKIQLWNKRKWS